MCIVRREVQADVLVDRLVAAGFASQDVSVLLPSRRASTHFAEQHRTRAPGASAEGIGAGGLVGGALGLLAGLGALAIPGLGPLVAAGPLAVGLGSAATVATVGGLAGHLVGMGIPEIEAKLYERKLQGGDIVVSVQTEGRRERRRAEETFRGVLADDIVSASDERDADPAASRRDGAPAPGSRR